jgi:hypothetical protein
MAVCIRHRGALMYIFDSLLAAVKQTSCRVTESTEDMAVLHSSDSLSDAILQSCSRCAALSADEC